MAAKQRIVNPACHRAVNWNEKAIQKCIDEDGYVLVGIKVDGMRCHVMFVDGELHFLTREGIEINALKKQAAIHDYFVTRWYDEWKLSPNCVLDCEVWIPGLSFQEGIGILRRDAAVDIQEHAPQFVVLDCISRDELLDQRPADFVGVRFAARYPAIVQRWPYIFGTAATGGRGVVSEALKYCESIEEIRNLYTRVRELGHEGLIVKAASGKPRNGKVAGQWKLKPGGGAPGWEGDGEVVGYVWGDADKANAGKVVGFRVRLEDGSESNATGLTQAQIAQYTGAVKGFESYIGRLARIEAMERTPSGSLRHPKFCGFRDLDHAPGVIA